MYLSNDNQTIELVCDKRGDVVRISMSKDYNTYIDLDINKEQIKDLVAWLVKESL